MFVPVPSQDYLAFVSLEGFSILYVLVIFHLTSTYFLWGHLKPPGAGFSGCVE